MSMYCRYVRKNNGSCLLYASMKVNNHETTKETTVTSLCTIDLKIDLVTSAMLTDEILGDDIHKNCAFERKT